MNGTTVLIARRTTRKLAASACTVGCLTMALAFAPSASADSPLGQKNCIHLTGPVLIVTNVTTLPGSSMIAECLVIP